MMPMPAKDLSGKVFGYLTVVCRAPTPENARNKTARWRVRCVCGKEIDAIGVNLRNDREKKSCGCRRSEQLVSARGSHGMTKHPAWVSWRNMRLRCTNPEDKDWHNYGGRGITVCEAWLNSFDAFWLDMGPTWAPGLTLDREKNALGYSPDNCRWATPEEQGNNTRVNVRIQTPKGEMTVAQAAKAFGVKPVTLRQRIRKGWPPEQWFIAPVPKPLQKQRASLTS